MPVESPSPELAEAPETKSTYGQILKSTALIGGSSVVNLAIGIFRAKTMALILGPSGVGLNGLYGSISNLAEGIAGMGINSSGVRQIAEATGTGDTARIAKTATVLRRISLYLGIGGAVILAAFSPQVSVLTFGDDTQTFAVCLLAVALLFRLVSAGQGALLQGVRRIADVARIGVLSAFFGTLITIPLVYFFKASGVAWSLVGVAGVTLFFSWWYSRDVLTEAIPITTAEVRSEALDLLKLGTAFMVSALLMMGGAYVIRAAILQQLGLEAAGLYQAAWSLGGLYTNFILQAMGSDFYPRLTAVASDDKECNRLVNEQAHVSLLLAGTGIIGTLTFAPLIVDVFYASNFGAAVSILRWICLGAALQVISWPMGFIIVARNAKAMFIASDLLWTVVHIGLAWFLMQKYGLDGAGMAFFGAYLFHAVFNYVLVARLSGFQFSDENKKACWIYLLLIGAAFGAFFVLPFLWAVCLGGVVALLSGVYSAKALVTLVSPARIPRPMRRLLAGIGMLPAETA
jgi:PST family polysaccharide transporter